LELIQVSLEQVPKEELLEIVASGFYRPES